MYWFLVFCAAAGSVQGGFFDLTDVDDPFALLWNFQPIRDKLTTCGIDQETNTTGVCMERTKCLMSGGTVTKKKCGPFVTCCSLHNDCSKTSDKKQAHFISGLIHPATTSCQYTIKLRNKNVCQVRLDFEELTLAPTILIPQTNLPNSDHVFKCANDSLHIQPDPYGVPTLCGNNTKQHLYIHVNQSAGTEHSVRIDIRLASRLKADNEKLPQPKWRIKFTQLECPLRRHKFDLLKFGDVENINNDFYSLAPQGAVQYFTENTGEFRSFALSTAETLGVPTSYPYGLHYTIAFRRPTDVCGIKFIPSKMNVLADLSNPVETICKDYLFVPEYFAESAATGSTLVGDNVAAAANICSVTNSFYSLVPGPFYVNFKSKGTVGDYQTDLQSNVNLGFVIGYELQASSSCTDNIS